MLNRVQCTNTIAINGLQPIANVVHQHTSHQARHRARGYTVYTYSASFAWLRRLRCVYWIARKRNPFEGVRLAHTQQLGSTWNIEVYVQLPMYTSYAV